ncbi:MAG: hypothetical protein LUB56_01070 [Coprobacillus sp.]|nr:hypothetical protein [Coprobacillus sp.]
MPTLNNNKKQENGLSDEEKENIKTKNQYVAYDHKYRRKKSENIQISVFTLIIGTIIIAVLLLFFMMYNLWGAFWFALSAEGALIVVLVIFLIYTFRKYNPLIEKEDEVLKKQKQVDNEIFAKEKEKEEAEKVKVTDPSAGPSSRYREEDKKDS